jgi:hypothetical protein
MKAIQVRTTGRPEVLVLTRTSSSTCGGGLDRDAIVAGGPA